MSKNCQLIFSMMSHITTTATGLRICKLTKYIENFQRFDKEVKVATNRCTRRCMSTASGVDLSYKIIGYEPHEYELPPAFLFHGLLGFKRHWQGLGKTLMKVTKRSVVIVDMRNHGWSPHVRPHKYELMALDVLKLFEKLKIEKATLIGHSMGGRTAMVVALMQPSKVDNQVIIDISPLSTAQQLKDFFPKLMIGMKDISFKGFDTIPKAREAAKKQLKSLIKDDVVMFAILSNIHKTRSGEIGWICNLDVLIEDFKYVAQFPESMKGKSYLGPTLFIGGQLSDFIPPDDLTTIREYFPRAMVKYVPKAGHNVHADDPNAFLQLVISFLRANEEKTL